MRKVFFINWFSDGFVPSSPEFMPRYGDDSDRYEYCECLMRTYRNEGALSPVFEKMRQLVRDRFFVDIIGIRMEPYTDKKNNRVVNMLRFGTLDSHDNEEKIADSELCGLLSELAGIRIDSFYIANELQNFHWRFFVDSGLELAGEYEGHPGISSIKIDPSYRNGWQIVVSCELDEELIKNKKDGLDMQIASRAYDIYDSKDFLDCEHESMNIRFTSVETECEKVMKPCSEAEVLFADKSATTRELTVTSIKKFNDARGYLFLEIASYTEGDRSYNYYTDVIKFPPDTTFAAENIRELLSRDYGLYPQYMIRKDNFELKRIPLYGVEQSKLRFSEIVFKDKYAAASEPSRTEPVVISSEPAPVPQVEPDVVVLEVEPDVTVSEDVESDVEPDVEPLPAEPEVQAIFKPMPQAVFKPESESDAQPVQNARENYAGSEPVRGYKKKKYIVILSLMVLVLIMFMSKCVRNDIMKYKEDWETVESEYNRVVQPASSYPDILYSDIDGTETDGRYSNDYTGVAFDIPEDFYSVNVTAKAAAKSPFDAPLRSADEKIEMRSFCLDEAFYFYDSDRYENIIVDLFYLPGYADQDTSAKFVLIVALNELNSFYESKSSCVPATFMGEVKGYVKYYEYSDVMETRTKAIFCTYHNSIATLITINCPNRSDIAKYITEEN